MFYPCDFEVKRIKEQEIHDRVRRAETERLIRSIHPRHTGWTNQSSHRLLHSVGQLFIETVRQREAPDPKTNLIPRENST